MSKRWREEYGNEDPNPDEPPRKIIKILNRDGSTQLIETYSDEDMQWIWDNNLSDEILYAVKHHLSLPPLIRKLKRDWYKKQVEQEQYNMWNWNRNNLMNIFVEN